MPKALPRVAVSESVKYYTIYNPYPPHPNMELVGDQKTCAFWLAGIVGKPDWVISIYHKPRSPSAIIVGISDAFEDLRGLLGAHKWSDFLRSPGNDGGRVSKIYFCARTSHDEIAKYGWKLNEVEDAWFAGKWRIDNKVIKFPYPVPSYCDIPKDAAALIELDLARRHPVDIYPEGKKYQPPPQAVHVVGSHAYIAANAKRTVPGAPAAEPPKAPKPRRRKKKAEAPSPPTPDTATTPTEPTEPVDSPPSDNGLPPARAPDGDWFTAAAAAAGLNPDSVVGVTPVTSWAAEVDAASHPQPDVQSKAHQKPKSTTNTNSSFAKPPSSSAPPGLTHSGLADAMANMEMEDYEEYDGEYGGYEYDAYSDTLAPEDSASNVGGDRKAQNVDEQVDQDEEVEDDGWGGAQIFTYNTPKPINAKRPGQPTDCPEHGLVCPRGICKFQAAKKAKEEREKERLEKKKARDEAIEKANKRKFGPKGKEREPPPHWHTAKSTDSSSVAPGDSVSMQGSRPGSPSDFDDEGYGEGDNDDDEARTEMGTSAPRSATGWTAASSGYNKAGVAAGPSVAASSGLASSQNGQQAARSATGWTDASFSAGAAWKVQQPASTYGTQASKASTSTSRSGWGNANSATQTSSNGGAWRNNGPASVIGGQPSKASSAVSKSGWTEASAIPPGDLPNGSGKQSGRGPASKAASKPAVNGGWDDDARSNVTVGRSNAGGNTASALGLPIVEKDPWDDTLSERSASTTNGWGTVPAKGRASGRGAPPQRARGGRGQSRGQGRGWNAVRV